MINNYIAFPNNFRIQDASDFAHYAAYRNDRIAAEKFGYDSGRSITHLTNLLELDVDQIMGLFNTVHSRDVIDKSYDWPEGLTVIIYDQRCVFALPYNPIKWSQKRQLSWLHNYSVKPGTFVRFKGYRIRYVSCETHAFVICHCTDDE